MTTSHTYLVVLEITQDKAAVSDPNRMDVRSVPTWDWTSNDIPGETWRLVRWVGGVIGPSAAPASEGFPEAAAVNTPAARPASGQEVTLSDFPAAAPEPGAYAPGASPSRAEYTEQTGRRFRMTKEQKGRGLTGDEAFVEMCANL